MIAVCGRSGVQWKHESERCAGVMILIYCHSSFIRRASGMKTVNDVTDVIKGAFF